MQLIFEKLLINEIWFENFCTFKPKMLGSNQNNEKTTG